MQFYFYAQVATCPFVHETDLLSNLSKNLYTEEKLVSKMTAYEEYKKMHTKFWLEYLKGRDHFREHNELGCVEEKQIEAEQGRSNGGLLLSW